MNPAALLRAQRHALTMAMLANKLARVDRVGRKLLDNLNDQMGGYVAWIDSELGRGALFAEDPATLADLIKQSADQRALGAEQSQLKKVA